MNPQVRPLLADLRVVLGLYSPLRLCRRMGSAAVVLAMVSARACSSPSSTDATKSNDVQVKERDFRITVQAEVPSGDVVLSVRNDGPDNHELIVVPAFASGLPLRRDGLTVDEESFQPGPVGVLEPGAPGSVRRLHVHLAPGRYVLFCNMAGHYLGGMHEILVAR